MPTNRLCCCLGYGGGGWGGGVGALGVAKLWSTAAPNHASCTQAASSTDGRPKQGRRVGSAYTRGRERMRTGALPVPDAGGIITSGPEDGNQHDIGLQTQISMGIE